MKGATAVGGAIPSPGDGWILLIHSLPQNPAYARVKVSRRLQKLGAVQLKSTVYALPATHLEDFQWLRKEILADGGEAMLIEGRFIDGMADDDVIALFRRDRDAEYGALIDEITAVAKNDGGLPSGDASRLRRRFEEIDTIDFFQGARRSEAAAVLEKIQQTARASGKTEHAARFRGKTWVTRQSMHVDRLACAWLVRRFVERDAKLKLVGARGYVPEEGEVLFDMFDPPSPTGIHFDLVTHEGDRCSFEVLIGRLGLSAEPGLVPLAEVIHDLDVKDGKFGRREADGIGATIDAICAAHPDDDHRLGRATAMFDDLLALFAQRERSA